MFSFLVYITHKRASYIETHFEDTKFLFCRLVVGVPPLLLLMVHLATGVLFSFLILTTSVNPSLLLGHAL